MWATRPATKVSTMNATVVNVALAKLTIITDTDNHRRFPIFKINWDRDSMNATAATADAE